jgi:cystathionine beta-lyase/cystathionine gamma-synthase
MSGNHDDFGPRRVPWIVDDVVATPVYVDLAPFADLIATQRTNSRRNCVVMGGIASSAIHAPLACRIDAFSARNLEDLLWMPTPPCWKRAFRTIPHRMMRPTRTASSLPNVCVASGY